MTHLTTPLTTHEDTRSTLSQSPSSKPYYPLRPLGAILELWHVLQIPLNTSKPPKGKNVQNLKAHNFAVDWHLKFEEILGEKRC
jgi:hypothetical protein